MQLPTIHLNGTSKLRLIENLQAASEALENAYQKLKETAPNGRDYYPQGSYAMQAAVDQHESRTKRLDTIKTEIDELMIAIDGIQ